MSKVKSMIINVVPEDKKEFNRLALHPLQSWEWGEFRQKTGIEVVRLGRYENNKLVETAQLTIHAIPFTSRTIGYLPKSGVPSKEMLEKIFEIGKQYRCIFIKLEPNIKKDTKILRYEDIKNNKRQSPNILISQYPNIYPSPHPLFTQYTFQLDLTKTEDELLKNMHPKTRYNIKVAEKHKVAVVEDNSDQAFNTYLDLLSGTTRRQKFYAHDRRYHQLMWETLRLRSGQALTAHLLKAIYQGKILAVWILFLFNDVIYYPYGASSHLHRNVMVSNLMMWEAIQFGKKHQAKIFDLWGALGSNPNPADPWYGFHRFKQGYGPKLIEFVGSYDLVINLTLYRLYNLAHRAREIFLKIKVTFNKMFNI